MKKIFLKTKINNILIVSFISIFVMASTGTLIGCGENDQPLENVEIELEEQVPEVDEVETVETEVTVTEEVPVEVVEVEELEDNEPSVSQTIMGEEVPEEYFEVIEEAGTVLQVKYTSKDYAGDGSDIIKEAYVYLPYGYDESNPDVRYDVVYLMHGLEGYAGEFFDCWSMKYMLDHMIKNGDIEPMILVSATFYYEGCEIDYDSSVRELKVFKQDFEENLMPCIERQFHTYAESTSKEDLIASRSHRAFGGFSLGAYTTWMQFCYNCDYIEYYLPISGGCWVYGGRDDFQTVKNVDYMEQVIRDNNLDEKGYFICYCVGTEDEIKDQTTTQAEEMFKRKDIFTPEHFLFLQMEGGVHDRRAERDFMYNGLPLFFK